MELPKKCKSNVNCCVYGCHSVYRSHPNLSFHNFPRAGKDKVEITDAFNKKSYCDRRKLWEVRLKIGKKISKSTKVCSLHFQEEDYLTPACHSQRYLKNTAIPTQNLPSTSSETRSDKFKISKIKQKEDRFERLAIRRNIRQNTAPPTSGTYETIDNTIQNDKRNDAVDGLLQLSTTKMFKDASVQVGSSSFDVAHAEVQVSTGDLITVCDVMKTDKAAKTITVCDVMKTDKAAKTLTGLPSLKLLETLVKICESLKCDRRTHRLSIKHRIILTMMKIKLDLTYVAISVLFGNMITSQTCKTVFYETTEMLSKILKRFIPFPSRDENLLNIPKCFENFQNVRVILDCIEIFLDKPKKLCCKIKFYSNYKKHTTVKFLTGVNPAGLITYVSPAYGGRVSDKVIFEQSNLLEKLDPYVDEIMVDKGFLIERMCDEYGIKLIRPPFLRKKKQLSRSESLLNVKIAAARVHIERTNARIKIFRLLKNTVPVHLIPIIFDIMIIVCAITNLSNPILSNDRFIK